MRENDLTRVHDFWFGGEARDAAAVSTRQAKLWWGKSVEVDKTIRQEFERCLLNEANGDFFDCIEPRQLLSRVILLDQFSRNMYRETARAFSFDERARGLAEYAVAHGLDKSLYRLERVFIYLPFEHSESLADQLISERLFAALCDEAPDEERSLFKGYLNFAQRHREIVERFSRFPHRNNWLGRESTEEETAFLQTPGSSF